MYDDEDLSTIPEDRELPAMNVSSYRLLYIYLLLCQAYQLSIEDLNTQLLNNPKIARVLTHETLGKYIYTLRLAGCEVQRSTIQGHTYYRLETHPFKVKISPGQEKALLAIIEHLKLQPLPNLYKDFYCLLTRLITLSPETTPLLMQSILNSDAMNDGISPRMAETLKRFQKYCSEAQVVEIGLQDGDGSTKLVLLEPQEVRLSKKRVFIVGNDPKTNRKTRYDIERIRSHRQLPSRVRFQSVRTTVTFILKGRLARNYIPYPGETVQDKGEFLLIKHETEELEQLLVRLLKYGSQCQVVSPDFARKEMLNLIEHLFKTLSATALDIRQYDKPSKEQTSETLRKWACYLDNLQTSGDATDD